MEELEKSEEAGQLQTTLPKHGAALANEIAKVTALLALAQHDATLIDFFQQNPRPTHRAIFVRQ